MLKIEAISKNSLISREFVFIYKLFLKPFSANKHDTRKGIIKNVSSIEERDEK